MKREEVLNSIRLMIADGLSDADIRAALIRDGLSDDEIKDCLNEVHSAPPSTEPAVQPIEFVPVGESNYNLALAGALIGMLVAAGVWAAIAWYTEREIGYVALGAGWLCGYLTARIGGGKNNKAAMIAVCASVLSIVAAKYIVMMLLMHKFDPNIEVEWLSLASIRIFPTYLAEIASWYDILFIGLAVITAWSVASPDNDD